METGKALKAALEKTAKTVLLVGAWIPFGEPGSDAPEQMGFALETLRAGVPGVYIAMDRRLWDPQAAVKKEILPGEFRLVPIDK